MKTCKTSNNLTGTAGTTGTHHESRTVTQLTRRSLKIWVAASLGLDRQSDKGAGYGNVPCPASDSFESVTSEAKNASILVLDSLCPTPFEKLEADL